MDDFIEPWGDGLVAGSAAAHRLQTDDAFREWAGALERLAASPATIRRDHRADRRDRRARRPPDDPRPDAGHAPARGPVPQGRALPLPRRAHPRRALRRARGHREPDLLGRLGGGDRRDRGVPDRHPAHQREPDRVLATVLFTDIVGSTERAAAMGDSGWREHPRGPRPAGSPRDRAPPRPGGQVDGRRRAGDLRRARPRDPRREPRSRTASRSSGFRSAPASTPANAR